MRASVKKLSDSEVELEIEIPAEEFDRSIERACLSFGKDLEIKGFRKGRAPKEFVEKEIGKENHKLVESNIKMRWWNFFSQICVIVRLTQKEMTKKIRKSKISIGVDVTATLRWTPSLGQDKGYVKSGSRYPHGTRC